MAGFDDWVADTDSARTEQENRIREHADRMFLTVRPSVHALTEDLRSVVPRLERHFESAVIGENELHFTSLPSGETTEVTGRMPPFATTTVAFGTSRLEKVPVGPRVRAWQVGGLWVDEEGYVWLSAHATFDPGVHRDDRFTREPERSTIRAQTVVRLDDDGLRRYLCAQHEILFPTVFIHGEHWTKPGKKVLGGIEVTLYGEAPRDPRFYNGSRAVGVDDPPEAVEFKWYVWDERPDPVRERIFKEVRATIEQASA